MSWGYPDGCTQADHDRAFNELGPSPAELAAEADAENDFDADYPDDDEEEFEFDCHMDSNGVCGAAGSEECEMECPYNEHFDADYPEKP